ncbi:MAG: sensor histidine kinase [Myxococcaceae bacterium]
MRFWSGTTRRVFFAFGALILIFGAASFFTLRGFTEVHDGLHDLKSHEASVRDALQLASAVRDQYAHQAHTIIIGNDSHLRFYDEARRRVLALTERVRANATGEEERGWVKEIDQASVELDRVFRDAILPAVLKNDRPTVEIEHGRGLELVSLIQDRADRLAARFEASIGDFEEHAGAVQQGTFLWTLALLCGATLFAAAVGVYIGRSVARPIARLEAGAARLAQGDLSTRIEISTPDEFGNLARHLNAMTASLKEHQEKLVQSEKLAGIGRLAAGVAHEINNPLGVILGFARVLQKKAEGSLAEDLKVIEDETLRCKEIVEELLDLSRPLKVAGEQVDLRALCEEVAARQKEGGTRIVVEGEGAVHGHGAKLRQVMTNLIKNAAEASGASGEVRVSISGAGRGVQVAVKDTGPGLTDETRAHLFEPFFTTKASGTGLGLAVSQAIAHAHGGGIEASADTGSGAVFILRLPGRSEEAA